MHNQDISGHQDKTRGNEAVDTADEETMEYELAKYKIV